MTILYKIVNGESIEIPQEEQLKIEAEWEANSIRVNKEDNNRKILQQLYELDLKSIRAIRTNDTARMLELENEAITLRSQLIN